MNFNESRIQSQQRRILYPRHGKGELTDLKVIDTNGKIGSITLPGCFNLQLQMRFNEDVENPYIESFLDIGGEKPCNNFEENLYCPKSRHPGVRIIARDQRTW